MPGSDARATFRRIVLRAAAVPPLLLLIVAALLCWQIRRLVSDLEWVSHTDLAIARLEEIAATFLELESHARLFALGGDDRAERDGAARRALHDEIQSLCAFVADNPPQVERGRELDRTISSWDSYVEQVLRDRAGAAGLYRTKGAAFVSEVRDRTGAMIGVERELSEARIATANRSATRTIVLSVASASGIALLVIAGVAGKLVPLGRSYAKALDESEERMRALAESEQKFRLLVERARDYAIFVLDLNGRIVSWNVGAERMMGWTAGEILGQPLSTLHLPEDAASDLFDQEIATARSRGLWTSEVIRRRKDGTTFWAHASLSPLEDKDGHPIGYVKIMHDITERKAAAEELERRVAERISELRLANEDLEAFGYSVSHDLKTPLRAMHAFGDTILEDYGSVLGEEGRSYVEQIVVGARRMDLLINDLLSYSRLSRQEIQLQVVALDGVVDEVLGVLGSEIASRSADVTVARPLPSVRAHRPTLVLVVQNLVANGLKFVATGARPRVSIRAERRSPGVRVWVDDEGIGISPEHHPRIFRVFERLHGSEAFPGTGMGLAIVKKGSRWYRAAIASTRAWLDLTSRRDRRAPRGPPASARGEPSPARSPSSHPPRSTRSRERSPPSRAPRGHTSRTPRRHSRKPPSRSSGRPRTSARRAAGARRRASP